MDNLTVDVKLWNENVGTLAWNEDKGVAAFEFDDKFLKSNLDIAPITMPLSRSGERVYEFVGNKTNCFKGLPGLFADALPDDFGNQIINEWFANHGLAGSVITPLDRLCYVGQRAMGALEFEPSKMIDGLGTSSVVHIQELTELAKSVLNDRQVFQDKLTQRDKPILDILKIGTSAGGAKPKAIIAFNELTGEVRSGQVKAPQDFSYWLLKFDGMEYGKITDNPLGIGNIEYAYYLMAKDAGINMMESKLLQEGIYNHFMTKRFDRTSSGEKLHVQTLAGIAHFDRDQRHSYEEAFRILRTLKLSYPEQEEFFRRMVFNVVARNHDDHTKNHSFLMDRTGKWKLAPAYDLCYSYSPSGTWTNKHQMSLNGKQDDFIFSDLTKVADRMGINNGKEIVEKVVDTVARWDEFAKEAGVSSTFSAFVKQNLLLLKSVSQFIVNDSGIEL